METQVATSIIPPAVCPPVFSNKKMKTPLATILASSIFVAASVLASSLDIALPANVTLYAKPGIGDGQHCLVGAQTDDDGMNEKPVIYFEKSPDTVIWHASLPLPPHTYQARATHCAGTTTTLYVLVQGDTQSEQSLSQTLLEVVALNRATGAITATKTIDIPNVDEAHTTWVDNGDEHFLTQNKDLIIAGQYAPLSNQNKQVEFSLTVPMKLSD